MMATTFEFEVDGWISEQAREAFCDMTIEELPSGARLFGDVTDESHLLGIFAQFRSLGLVVVSAHRVTARPRSTFS
jgi:allantoicase